jgi:cell division protein ZapA
MDSDQNITVTIAGRPYRLKVNRKEEEIVRKAAEKVNKTILEYSESFEYKDHQDLFAMITLQATAYSIQLEEEKKFRDNELEIKLSELDGILTSHLGEDESVL